MQKHHPTEPVVTRLGRDLQVRVYPHDVIGRHIFIDGMSERDEWMFAERYVKEGMTVLDLGANLGQYTLLAAMRAGPTGSVHSFEPSRRMFEELTFNVALNGFGPRCVLNNVAVSDRVGHANLTKYSPGYEVYGALAATPRATECCVGAEQVATIRLDDYVASHGLDHVDFMKVDIEGAELMALRGAERLLSQARAPTILIELADINTRSFGYEAIAIWDYLVSLGYTMNVLGFRGHRLHPIERPRDFLIARDLVAVKGHPPGTPQEALRVRKER